MLLNRPVMLPLMALNAPTMPIETRPAMKAYSVAVAPPRHLRNRRNSARMSKTSR